MDKLIEKIKKLEIAKNAKTVCLIGHIDPDADALSSMVVFKSFLTKTFKIKTIDLFADCEQVSNSCQPILGKESINKKPKKQYDFAVMMDSPNVDRLGKYANLFQTSNHKISIDHHNTNQMLGELNIVANVSSCCEIVYMICKEYGYTLSNSEQGKIYAGLITDTNNFSVGNVSENTFKIASEIIPHINKDVIVSNFFSNNSLHNMKVLAQAINNTSAFESGKIVMSFITNQQAEQLGCNPNSYIGIINRLTSISHCCLVSFVYPKNDLLYVALRARNGFDVSKLAIKNNGGGHIGASGYLSDKSLEETNKDILDYFIKEIKSKKGVNFNIF